MAAWPLLPAPAQAFKVGGAVRDELLGLPASDSDWVVVGGSPQLMLDAGFRPVGRDFPVFLHPHSGEEFALARTERKSAPGYHGFAFHAAPDVTLEQDLARRDLTINAMARGADGVLVDPHGGQADLRARVLHHVSPAFAEDPVRILRVARFAARFVGFTLADATLEMMRAMVAAGEVDALVSERVWLELARGLMEQRPSRMIELLANCDALGKLLPELDATAALLATLDAGAAQHAELPVRYACLAFWVTRATSLPALGERLRVGNECQEVATVLAREHAAVQASAGLGAPGLLALLERCDALRRPQRFAQVLHASDLVAGAGQAASPAPRQRLAHALHVVAGTDAAAAASAALARGERGPAVGQAVAQSRCQALHASLHASLHTDSTP